ncbi:MAG: aspartate kinase [Myxococcales bacterium]|nr:aspartate kinase [Myxococcales bacterium]
MGRIVCKFGGSSVANAAQLRKVRSIVEGDPRRSVVVPSAPGRQVAGEPKVTDLLYLCHEMASMKTNFKEPFDQIRQRFIAIERDLELSTTIHTHLDALETALRQGCSEDFAASRGEHFNGLLLAAYLDAEFVDPLECVFVKASGAIDPKTYDALERRLADPKKRYVMPGFYGNDGEGNVRTFSRGGSDISGAIAARAIHADVYENWTDVSGLLMADPRVVKNPHPMIEATYREIRELSYMGASVFHDEAMLPVQEVGIPIAIKNTNAPEDPGTRIVANLSPEIEKNTEIAAIAGRHGFSMVCVEKTLMNKEVGFGYRLLGIFNRHGVSFEHCPTSIDGMNVIVNKADLGDKADLILDEIRRTLEPDKVMLEADLALIAVVGEGMAKTVGIAAKVFDALRDAGANVRVINQGASELNIIIGVAPGDYERAVRAVYDSFLPRGDQSSRPPPVAS